jgi:uncharacterized protein (DUF4415 family)
MARVTWDERKRLRVLSSRGVDFIDAAGIFDGPRITLRTGGAIMARHGTSRSVLAKETTSSSSTRRALRPRVKTYSISSLLGELDDEPDSDIRTYSLDELHRMRKSGLGRTRPDAEEIELDDSFWKHAQLMLPPSAAKKSVHLRVDYDVLDWFKSQGKGHLTRMNHVLRAYYQANRERPKRSAARARQQKKTARS